MTSDRWKIKMWKCQIWVVGEAIDDVPTRWVRELLCGIGCVCMYIVIQQIHPLFGALLFTRRNQILFQLAFGGIWNRDSQSVCHYNICFQWAEKIITHSTPNTLTLNAMLPTLLEKPPLSIRTSVLLLSSKQYHDDWIYDRFNFYKHLNFETCLTFSFNRSWL